MFDTPHDSQRHSPSEPSYMRKKRIFSEHIRKKDRANLINRLRKNAQLPDDLLRMVKNLPQSIHDLISKIGNLEIVEWEESIAYLILHNKNNELRHIFEGSEIGEKKMVSFFIFLLKKGNEEVLLYNQCFNFILNASNQWAYPERIELLWVFILMLRKGHSYILQDAIKFLSKMNSNRFFQCQLRFYDTFLRKFPTSDNINAFLPSQTLKKLSQQIGIHFYSEQEKILMMEILIQVLYLSSQPQIAKSFELELIFGNLEYFFGFFNTNKMLIDRSILLIYNINIDATSQRFVKHNCFQVIACEMKNKDNPTKIRSLMAQLYLNSIFHYPEQHFYRYLLSNLTEVFLNFEYIVDEFGHDNDIKQMSLELLRSILSVCAQEKHPKSQDNVSNYIRSNSSFLKALQSIKQAEGLLEQFHILEAREQL